MAVRFPLRTRLLLGAVALAVPGLAHAEDITGTVYDASETRTLEGAEVTIVELGRTAQAESNGRYRFTDVAPGTYTLRVRYAGAEPTETSIIVAQGGVAAQDLLIGTADSEILVLGQTANLLSAVSRQRAADGVESVLTRDAVGQFPDQNVSESLRRLPGINVLDDQGEGRYVSVRGLDPNLNSSSINGVRLPSPESDVRQVALDVISSDSIESIEVKKSLTPDMDADTIGASIEIKTVSAFDRKKDLLTVSAEGSYNHLRDTFTPKGSVDFSHKFGDDFGVAGGFSYYQRKFSTDNIEAADWATAGGVTYAETMEYRDYDVERNRYSGSLSFDFRPSDSTTLYLRGVYSQFDDQEFRNRLTIILNEEPRSGDANSAFFSDDDGRIEVRRDLKDRFERQRVRSITAGGETAANGFVFSYQAAWSKSTELEDRSLDPTRFRARFDGDGVDIHFDYSNEMIPQFDVTGGLSEFVDPDNYSFNRIERTALSDSHDEEWALKADVARTFGVSGGDFTVQGGIKSRWRKKGYNFELEYYGDYNGALEFADLVGQPSYGLANLYPALDWDLTRSFFYDNQADFELDDIESAYGSAADDYESKEDILAGYLLGRWDSNALRVIGGVRVERTSNELRGNTVNLYDDPADGPCNFEVCVAPVTFTRSYTDWLPSLTVRFEPSSGVVLRAAGYKSLVRPNLNKLAPRFLINEDDEAEFGNPDLKPYRAWNLDLSAEYYFARNGAISVNYFHKEVKDFIVDALFDDPATDPFGGTYNGVSYTQASVPLNGETATINGVEFSYNQLLNFLPGPLDGLLVQFNYTFTDAKGTVLTDGNLATPREITLPASSRNTFNAVLGYEKGPISLRVAGTYRDKYLDEVGSDASGDRYVTDHFQLDLSAKYKVTSNIQIFADWINVTNEPYFAYQNFAGRRRLLQYEEYGWTAKGGVKVKF